MLNQQVLDQLQRYRTNPASFVTDTWDVILEPFQAEALYKVCHGGRVSIRSGHGVGKSTLDAWAVIWFLSTHYPAKVPCTAPTAHQLEDVLWPEIAHWHQKMPDAWRKLYEQKADKFELKGDPKNSFAVARTGNKSNPEALQGFHSENLLFVLDEASGIDDVVFEVASGALSTPHARVLMTANPTRVSGYFYESHNRMADQFHCMHVPCQASTRVSDEYASEMAAQYGLDSNIYRVRVLGEFPRSEDDVAIPYELVESAVGRDVSPINGAPRIWGVDVARFGGDRSTLVKRFGNRMDEAPKVWRQKDTMQLAGLVHEEWDTTPKRVRPDQINVDVIGIGAGVVDRLKELGLPVYGVNVAESPSHKDRYMRLRDQLWFDAREWFDGRDVHLVDDQPLIGELTSLKYEITSAGKLKIESKDDAKKRGIPSPDIADAFVMTFAQQMKAHTWKPINYPNMGVV